MPSSQSKNAGGGKTWDDVLDKIFETLSVDSVFTDKKLSEIYNREKFGSRRWTADDLDPSLIRTWRRMVLSDNNKTGPRRAAMRLRQILQELKRIDVPEFGLTADHEPDWLAWFKAVRDRLSLRVRYPGDNQNLIFVGATEEGVKKFRGTWAGTTSVYNTVFTRSHPALAGLRPLLDEFYAIMREVLDTRCDWHDVVMDSEVEGIKFVRSTLSPEQLAKHKYRVLPTASSLVQCLVYKSGDDKGAALIGWMFWGSAESRVYFTDHLETVNYFQSYMHNLFWTIAKEPK
jgi:hypothetical protein